MNDYAKKFSFTKTHKNMTNVLTDHETAALGDAYVNFAYSLALSNRKREPHGAKVRGTVLAEALRRAGLRECLPSRMTRHELADAAEALIVYAWLHSQLTLVESVTILEKTDDPTEGFSQLLTVAKKRVRLS